MATKSNIIELNGKRYDAVTGAFLGSSPSGASARAIHTGRQRTVDGFVATSPKPAAHTPAVTKPVVGQPKPMSDVVRVPAKHVRHHQAHGSKTLMRHAVQKPAPASLKRHTKAQQRTDILAKQPKIEVAPKASSYQVDPRRVQRAKLTPRHTEVRRHAIDRAALARPTTAEPPRAAAKPAVPIAPVHADASAQALRQPQSPTTHSTDIFEQALARANMHVEQPTNKRHARHRARTTASKVLSVSAATLAITLLVGFFAWQQKANLTMRYAASKAGIAAHMPGFTPDGYASGPINYSSGKVAVDFTNNNGETYSIVQQKTAWDSSALLDSFVSPKARTFQTIDAAGRTIYTYGDNNATWVDNGVWYQVDTQGSLTTNQLVQLALSM